MSNILKKSLLTLGMLIGLLGSFAHAADTAGARKIHRLAIVIGNKDYIKPADPWQSLNSPEKDARDVSEVLIKNGYQVQKLTNTDSSTLRAATKRFLNRVDDIRADIIERKAETSEPIAVIFYFSGHGFSQNGQLYLTSVDGRGKYVDEITPASVLLTSITSRLVSDDQVELLSFLFLDACRTDINLPARGTGRSKGSPFKGSLVQSLTGSGTAILFASSDGQPSIDGRSSKENSIFTEAFLSVAKTGDDSLGVWGFLNSVALETKRISLAQGFRPPQLAEIRGTALADVRFKGVPGEGSSIDVAKPSTVKTPATVVAPITLPSGVAPPGKTTVDGKEVATGWIWLGNYYGKDSKGSDWQRATFQSTDGGTKTDPANIVAGTALKAVASLYARKDFPDKSRCGDKIPASGNYAACTPEVGVVEYGAQFTTVGSPKAVHIENKGYAQYWVQIKGFK